METSVLSRTNWNRPPLFDSRGWLEKVFNSPLIDYLNFCRAVESSAINLNEGDDQYKLSITQGPEKGSRTGFEYKKY
jgi:hypothetical protein